MDICVLTLIPESQIRMERNVCVGDSVMLWEFNDAPWWRHLMETFSALLAICAGNSPVPGEFPTQRPVTRSFDVFFDLQRLSKQRWGWWFETPPCPLRRHRNARQNLRSLRCMIGTFLVLSVHMLYSFNHITCTNLRVTTLLRHMSNVDMIYYK